MLICLEFPLFLTIQLNYAYDIKSSVLHNRSLIFILLYLASIRFFINFIKGILSAIQWVSNAYWQSKVTAQSNSSKLFLNIWIAESSEKRTADSTWFYVLQIVSCASAFLSLLLFCSIKHDFVEVVNVERKTYDFIPFTNFLKVQVFERAYSLHFLFQAHRLWSKNDRNIFRLEKKKSLSIL